MNNEVGKLQDSPSESSIYEWFRCTFSRLSFPLQLGVIVAHKHLVGRPSIKMQATSFYSLSFAMEQPKNVQALHKRFFYTGSACQIRKL